MRAEHTLTIPGARLGSTRGKIGAMELPALIDALEKALTRRGVTIRQEAISGAGGHCVLRGVPTVIVSASASAAERAEVLLEALRFVGPGDQWLPPALRERL
jgi:hypothetical protein